MALKLNQRQEICHGSLSVDWRGFFYDARAGMFSRSSRSTGGAARLFTSRRRRARATSGSALIQSASSPEAPGQRTHVHAGCPLPRLINIEPTVNTFTRGYGQHHTYVSPTQQVSSLSVMRLNVKVSKDKFVNNCEHARER